MLFFFIQRKNKNKYQTIFFSIYKNNLDFRKNDLKTNIWQEIKKNLIQKNFLKEPFSRNHFGFGILQNSEKS